MRLLKLMRIRYVIKKIEERSVTAAIAVELFKLFFTVFVNGVGRELEPPSASWGSGRLAALGWTASRISSRRL